MITKIDAARIATSAGIPVVLTTAEQAAEALAGEEVGTLVPPDRPPASDSAAHGCDTPATLAAPSFSTRAPSVR